MRTRFFRSSYKLLHPNKNNFHSRRMHNEPKMIHDNPSRDAILIGLTVAGGGLTSVAGLLLIGSLESDLVLAIR